MIKNLETMVMVKAEYPSNVFIWRMIQDACQLSKGIMEGWSTANGLR